MTEMEGMASRAEKRLPLRSLMPLMAHPLLLRNSPSKGVRW
jgi:hypothetical protein